jgi:hypothetical protein
MAGSLVDGSILHEVWKTLHLTQAVFPAHQQDTENKDWRFQWVVGGRAQEINVIFAPPRKSVKATKLRE